MTAIESRKSDHLRLAVEADVGFRRKTTLLECVELVHCSLPELRCDRVDTELRVLGRRLRAPLLIAGMTGGTERAGEINRTLAAIAEQEGVAFGLGSQRPMLVNSAAASTYQVREQAPTTLVLGNIGAVQASQTETARLRGLIDDTQADALCVHLNPAQELIQENGDRDFVGCEAVFSRLVAELGVPVVAKETGAGISPIVAERLRAVGVRHIDISGAGGTSWVAVETHRAEAAQQRLGDLLWDWGIPTAACILGAARSGFRTLIASGGIHNGLDVARAIALGATLVGVARPVLKALDAGGPDAAATLVRELVAQLRAVMVLCGAGTLRDLQSAPRLIRGELAQWDALWDAQRRSRG